MAEWVAIEDSISLSALLARWAGIEVEGEILDFQCIDNLIHGSQLTAYDKKDWIINSGHKEWRGQKRSPILGLQGSSLECPGDDIIFDQEEISALEQRMFSTCKEVEQEREIPIDEIRKKLGMSPQEFTDFLNDKECNLITSWEESLRNHDFFIGPFFTCKDIKDTSLTVNSIDWKRFTQNNFKEFPAISPQDESYNHNLSIKISETEQQNDSLRKMNKFLNEQNKRLMESEGKNKIRISELEQELSSCRNPQSLRTEAAIEARKEKKLDEWKKAFKIMLEVVQQCRAEGPKPRTTPELEKMCTQCGGSLSKAQLTFMRECLGPEHVNTVGGPTIQG